MARVLLVNPNTNERTTDMMRSLAQDELAGCTVVGVTAAAGPSMITDPEALQASVPHVIAAVKGAWGEMGFDAVIVAAVGDPGRAELAGLLDVPVVGIGQASVIAASRGDRPFGMATSTPELVRSLEQLAAAHGGRAPFAGVHLTTSGPLALAADPERQFEELADAVDSCRAQGAEAVIIAGGPLSETARRLAARGTATIVEPIPSACRLVAEALGIKGPNSARESGA